MKEILLRRVNEIHNESSDLGHETNKQYNGMLKFEDALLMVIKETDNQYGYTELNSLDTPLDGYKFAMKIIQEVIERKLK